MPDDGLLAIQTQRELQKAINDSQCNEILSAVCFAFVLSVPSQQAIWFGGREQQRQQNVLLLRALYERRTVQFDVAVSFVLTRKFKRCAVLANVAGEMDGTVANEGAAFAFANAIVFAWIVFASLNNFIAIGSSVTGSAFSSWFQRLFHLFDL